MDNLPLINLANRGTAQVILICNGVAQHMQLTHSSTVEEVDLVADLRTTGTVATPPLPVGCRLYSEHVKDGETGIERRYIIERPPRIVPATMRTTSGDVHMSIALPYVVYTFSTFASGVPTSPKTFWSPTPIKSLGDSVYLYAFPNHYLTSGSRGSVCLGGAFDGAGACKVGGIYDLDKYVNYIETYIAHSRYNHDLSQGNDLSAVHPNEWTSIDLAEATEEELPARAAIMTSSSLVKAMARAHVWTHRAANPLIDVCQLGMNFSAIIGDLQ